MSKYRKDARVDDNQPGIVKNLLSIPGVSVKTKVDDIFIGYKGRNYWVEIKNPNTANKKGVVFESKIKKSQKELRENWCGQYDILTTFEEICELIGV